MAAMRKASRKKAAPKTGARKAAKKGTKKATARPAKKAAAKKKAAPKRAKAAKPKKAAKKRAPNPAFMKPMTPSSDLAAIVGAKPIPRTEVTKKLWAYIKRNGLQDAKERRNINADDALRKVFGGKARLSMFDMTKAVNKHLK